MVRLTQSGNRNRSKPLMLDCQKLIIASQKGISQVKLNNDACAYFEYKGINVHEE